MKNIVLITIDSLRFDAVSNELTPELSSLADEGINYTQIFSNGYSTPIAFPSIQTGTYPDHYGGTEYMSDSRPFLARELANAGYRTAGFHSNPHLRAENNYDTGYEVYNDFENQRDSLTGIRYFLSRNLDNYSWLYKTLRRLYHTFRTKSGGADYTKAPKINDQALRWIDQLGEDPFFLWMHYMDVHYPFYPPDRFVNEAGNEPVSTKRAVTLNGKMQESPEDMTTEDLRDLRSLYEGDVRYADYHLGNFLFEMESRGLTENTLFVVTSDHGELFGENGEYGHPPSVSEESLHVPLIMNGPDLEKGTTVNHLGSLIDLAPTLNSHIGLELDETWDGKPLFPIGDSSQKTVLLGSKSTLACRTENWQLNRRESELGDVEWELWDVSEDREANVDEHAELVDQLRKEIDAYLEAIETTDESLPSVGSNEEVTAQLEALGYK